MEILHNGPIGGKRASARTDRTWAESPCLVEALGLLDSGYWPVAVHPPGSTHPAAGKAPINPAWGAEKPTPEQLRDTWAKHPNASVGIVLGPRGGVVDLEVDDPATGEDSLIAMLGGELVETCGWTSRRGAHRLFRWDDRLSEFTKIKYADLPGYPGLEIRLGTNGQAQSVCPPSPTTETDENGQTVAIGPREWTGSGEVAALPEAFYENLRAAIAARAPVVPQERPIYDAGPRSGDAVDRYAMAALAREVEAVESAGEGHRNDTLNGAAFNLGTLVGSGVLSRATAEAALTHAASVVGLSATEAAATIASGLNAGAAKPRDLSGIGQKAAPRLRVVSPHTDAATKGESDDLNATLALVESTDTGNADRLVARYGDQIRFCHSWKAWLVWDGRRWTLDGTGRVVEFAKATARAILAESATLHDDDDRKELAGWSFTSQSASRIAAMIKLAESSKSIAVKHEDLNRDPWAFNALNGTLDLRTGSLRPHRRDDLITQLAPVNYDPDAQCPLWLQAMDTFFRRADPQEQAAITDYWQKICGYAMTGVTDEHILPIAFGSGSNGKSTALEMVMDTFGPDYASVAPEGLLMARKFDSHPTELADLYGKRLVIGIETDEGRRLNEARVKALSDGTPVKARRMHEDFWQFKPTHTLILATNHKPKVKGTDNGIWRRLKLVPFTTTMPDDQADKAFPRKLRGLVSGFAGEQAGVLAWCVAGCLKWQREGLTPPSDVTTATESYRQEQDTIGVYLAERTRSLPGVKIKAGALYKDYATWANEAGENAMTQRAFGEAITTRGFEKKTSNGIWYLGIALAQHDAGAVEEVIL